MNFTPSIFQQDIFDFVKDGSGNAIVNAVAGSGKTTTIVKALDFIPSTKKVIFLAFNKAIVSELKNKVPAHVRVSTLHGLGWNSMMYQFGKHIKLNNYKCSDYVRTVSEAWGVPRNELREYGTRVRQLVDLARYNLITEADDLSILADKHGIDRFNGELRRALNVIDGMNTNLNEFDFTDMIYQPAHRSDFDSMFKYDFVFIDECQDLNIAQQAIVKKIIKPFIGRFIAVGDPSQSIYGFCGADVEAYNKLKSIPNTKELPLSVSYRCGKNIVEKAQDIVPQIEPFEDAIDGEVDYKGSIESVKDGDMILCRNTAPLVKLCMQFLRDEKKAYVKGGDIGKTLITLIERQKVSDIVNLFPKLYKERDRIKNRMLQEGRTITEATESIAYVLMQEKIDVIKVLSEDCKTTACIISKIERIFADDKAGICLSTIHKSKGLESNVIHVICEEMLPSKYAKEKWQKLQERNLEYVMITRAKQRLSYIQDWSFSTI